MDRAAGIPSPNISWGGSSTSSTSPGTSGQIAKNEQPTVGMTHTASRGVLPPYSLGIPLWGWVTTTLVPGFMSFSFSIVAPLCFFEPSSTSSARLGEHIEWPDIAAEFFAVQVIGMSHDSRFAGDGDGIGVRDLVFILGAVAGCSEGVSAIRNDLRVEPSTIFAQGDHILNFSNAVMICGRTLWHLLP